MSSLKLKFSNRVMALVLAVLMLFSMIPVTIIANAQTEPNSAYDYLKPLNLKAEYVYATTSIDIKWDTIVGDVDEVDVIINEGTPVPMATVDTTTYSYDVSSNAAGDELVIAVVAKKDSEERTSTVNVTIPYIFESIVAESAVNVDNDLTISEIKEKLPTEVKIVASDAEFGTKAQVEWSTEGTTYDKTLSTTQVFSMNGAITLPENVINPNNVPLTTTIDVNVAAAIDAAITTDLDDTASINKKVGDTLTLSVAANGTAPTYQWYKGDAPIAGETNATFTNSALILGDAGTYKCVVTGKNGVPVTSKEVTVVVQKNTTTIDLSIDPPAGQTRPAEITLEAIGVPDDATGKVVFYEGTNEIETINLPSNDISTTFNAVGATNNYDFKVAYVPADNEGKYLGSDKTISGYAFNKGKQEDVKFKDDTVPSRDITYSDGANFTVEAENSKTNKYEFAIIEEKDADGATATAGSVASINKDTGKVTISAAGTFKITVKALSNDDYNESTVVTSALITVLRAEQSTLAFETGESTITYFHNFLYDRDLSATGSGDGAVTYKLGAATTATGITVNNDGEITFTDNANDNSKNFEGSVGVVEIIVTKAKDARYNEKSASYTFTIEEAEQSLFQFDTLNPSAITYTANNGTTYTNAISTADDKNGWVNNGDNKPVYSIISQKALDDSSASDVVDLNTATGLITAKRSGIVTIKANLDGNGVYKAIDTTYTITINRGTVETGTTGFKFNLPDSSIKYGTLGFTNVASGGQSDTTTTVLYSDNSTEIAVDPFGVISFENLPASASTSEYNVTVTATKPETDKYNECSITYTLTVTRDAVSTATDFKVNGSVIKDASLLTSPNGWYNAEHANITITPAGQYTKISKDGEVWSESIVIDLEAKHDIAFYLQEANGATSLISNQKVNYDTTKATATLTLDNDNFWTKFLETITFGIWRAESKNIKIEASDLLSGVAKVEYYEQNSDFGKYDSLNDYGTADTSDDKIEFDATKLEADTSVVWKPIENNGNIPVTLAELTNKKVVIYAKVTDHAGNVSYFRTNGMVFDSITPDQETELPDPIIEIQLDDTTKEGLYDNAVPFKLTVNDEQTDAVASGIKNIKVTITGSAKEDYEKIINITSKKSEISSFNSESISNSEFDVDGTFEVPADFDSNYITILVEVEDYAGNKYTNSDKITRLAIDKTDPVIEVSYNDKEDTFTNTKYIGNNKNRIATIDITELNFDQKKVKITVKQDGVDKNIQSNFKAIDGEVDENGDQIGWRMVIDYATLGEGEFEFDIACVDKAERSNKGWTGDNVKVNKSFIIDNTKPVISVVITNDAVKNGKYFAADRTATVTILERNFSTEYEFDWSGLTYALDGQTLTPPTPKITKNDDGTYERVYTIDFSAEGDYTFGIKYTDLAGNLADTYACESVSYQEFTVDKTAPALEITGVADKSANNGDVAPIVSYSDINFDKDAVSIVLSGANNGTVNYSAAYADVEHGQTYTYANFEKVKNVDDIYTLTAKLTDKAGNETEKVISFSVNRFGSTYALSEEAAKLNGTYIKEPVDIVITETNADKLSNIVVTIFKNNETIVLTEGTDYTMDVTGGNGQWYHYTYTILAKNFADDAVYSITVESDDAAGNDAKNDQDTKNTAISFGVDDTLPIINIENLESKTTYALDNMTVKMSIEDNLKLAKVIVELDGKEYKVWSAEELEEIVKNGGNFSFDISGESTDSHNLVVYAVDAAGNGEKISDTELPANAEKVEEFYVTTNLWVRYYTNTGLFYGSIAGVILLAGLVVFLIVYKKRKNEAK